MGKKLKKMRKFAVTRKHFAEEQRFPGDSYSEYWEGEQTAYAAMIKRIDSLEGKWKS